MVLISISNAWNKMSFKMAILLGVCLQNAGYTLIRKYSTINESVSSKEILLVAEIIKVAAATYLTLTDTEKSDAQGQVCGRPTIAVQRACFRALLAQ